MHLRTHLVAASAALLLALTGCGSDDGTASDSGDSTTTTSAAADAADTSALTMTDPWIKAVDSGMTAAFGTLVNAGDADVTVTSVTTDVSDMIELHETVEGDDGSMAMQPKEGGFTVPAGGEHELAPGGDHIMFMSVTRALEPGEVVPLTLELSDGSTVEVEATVKNFEGADEKYQDGDDSGEDMGDMDMGDDSSDGS